MTDHNAELMTLTDNEIQLLMLESNRDATQRQFQALMNQRIELDRRLKTAFADYCAARVAYSVAKGHPMAGKAVRRIVVQQGRHRLGARSAPNPDRHITESGTVTLCGQEGGGRYRGYQPVAGEWFVLSRTGITAYQLDGSGPPWEIVK